MHEALSMGMMQRFGYVGNEFGRFEVRKGFVLSPMSKISPVYILRDHKA